MDTIVDNGDGTETLTVTEGDLVIATEVWPRTPAPATISTPVGYVAAVDLVALLVSALRDPLANLTASSESTTVRTAILNQRAALDALLAALETP